MDAERALLQTEHYCCHYVHRTMHEVRIINGFTSNSSMPLVIWCKSNQGDLGGHALQEGDDYILSFETNFWQRTDLLFCTMKWDRKRMSLKHFLYVAEVITLKLLASAYD
ncbi:hypothetical protein RJ639_038479 [Escallonia herrerae]|uniref:S-protein homolog n=1 Tax=Escallonia herrerae TaxID=1293975 RepID=A0AA89B692_9ASTE|nr:hypothetical protein RJ639_038479 [Escallonia herrerae]